MGVRFMLLLATTLVGLSNAQQQDQNLLLALQEVEQVTRLSVLDLAAGARCTPIDFFEYSQWDVFWNSHGTFMGGKITICGTEEDECFVYDEGTGQWIDGPRRLQYRFNLAAVDMSPNVHWVSGGGEAGTLPGPVYNTEIYDGEEFVQSIDLPFPFLRSHCVTRLDDTRAIIATGLNLGSRVLQVDLATGAIEDLPQIPLPAGVDYTFASCGLATKSDGSQVVVVAGGDDQSNASLAVDESYIYDVDGQFWTPGPFLPETRSTAASVQYGNSFLIVGGTEYGSLATPFLDTVLRYDPDGEKWEVLDQKLPEKSIVPVSFFVPDDFTVNCS